MSMILRLKKSLGLAALLVLASVAAHAADAPPIDKQKQRNGIAMFTLCYVSNSDAQATVIENTTREILLNQNQGKDAAVDAFVSGPFDKEMRAQTQNVLTVFQQEAKLVVDSLKQDEIDKLLLACLAPEERMRQLPQNLYTQFLKAGAPAVIAFEIDVLKKLQPQLKAAGLVAKFD
jgi:hypothetical protein